MAERRKLATEKRINVGELAKRSELANGERISGGERIHRESK